MMQNKNVFSRLLNLTGLFTIIYMILIFILSSIPGRYIGMKGFTLIDKWVHMIEYSILGVLILLTLKNRIINNKIRIISAVALSTFYGITDEIHQLFVPNRSFDYFDILADFIGSCAGVLLFYIVSSLLCSAGQRSDTCN